MATATQLQQALNEINGEFIPYSYRRHGQVVNRLLLVVNGHGNRMVKTNASNKLKLEVVAEEKARLAKIVTPSNAPAPICPEFGGADVENIINDMKNDEALLAELLGV